MEKLIQEFTAIQVTTPSKLEEIIRSTRRGRAHSFLFNPEVKQLSAGCIVIKENKVLLVLNKHSKKYGFPKGYADTGDVFLYKTALRELKEETSLILEKEQLFVGYIKRNNTYYFVTVLKDITLDSESKTDEGEIESIGWFDVEEIKTLPITQHLRSILVPELIVPKVKVDFLP